METLSIKVAKVVGTPDGASWSQVHTFSPQEQEKKQKRGTLLAVLSFSSPGEPEIAGLGKEILSRIHEEYFGEVDSGAMEKLTQTVSKIADEFAKTIESLEVVTLALVGNVAYAALFGGGVVWIKRGNINEKVLEATEEKVVNTSGFLEKGDLVVLGTTIFFQLAGEGVLNASLESGGPEEAVETLAPLLEGQEAAATVAALIGKVEPAETELVDSHEAVVKEESREVVLPPKKNFKDFLARVLAKISKVKGERIYIRKEGSSERSRHMVFSVAVLLIVLLVASVFWGIKERDSGERVQKFSQLYEETKSLAEQGEALAKLNPSQSREFLQQASGKLAELEKLGNDLSKTKDLKSKIEVALSLVINEYQLSDVPVFFDLTLIAAGGQGDLLAVAGDSMIVLDKKGSRVFLVSIERKSGEILSGGSFLASPKLSTVGGETAFVFDDNGVSQISLADKTGQKGKIALDKDWGEIIDLKAYSGNLYLLDKSKGALWRYVGVDGNFGAKQEWFAQGVSPDLSSAVSLAVDGSVWILRTEGKILRFSQGAPVPFSPTGLEKLLSNSTVIYTTTKTQNLYVLDKGNKRIVLLSKSGEYQAQYLWEGAGNISDMIVVEDQKKIFLLGGSKIYEIVLKQ